MPFGSSQWMYASGGFYNGVATQSLRFDSGSSARLEKTPSASDRVTWTWSAWVKRSKIGVERAIWSAGSTSGFALFFHSSDQLRCWTQGGNGAIYTNAVFRDTSAWYHIALTAKSSGNYFELYINGVKETSFSFDGRSTNPGGNDTEVNSNAIHYLGAWNNGGLQYFDGYLADVHFIDGTCVGDTGGILDEFIEIKNGVCIPKAYTGSYGTNGYRLEFKQTGTGSASSSTIGADTSGNANHFTSSGIVASDCDMPDSPENNWSTMNSLINGYGTNITMSEGNLAGTGTSSQYNNTLGTILMTSGKWYWEISSADFNNYDMLGIAIETAIQTTDSTPYGQTGVIAYATQGAVYNESASGTGSYTDFLDSEIIGIAVDLDSSPRTFKFYNNNTLQGTINLSSNFDDVGILPFFCIGNTDTIKVNFGQDSSFAGLKTAQGNTDDNDIGDFYYSPPSGYLALCSANLPEPTISPNADTQADDHFNTVIYDGNDDATRTFDVGFVSDFSWFKARSGAGYGHQLYDSVRGVQLTLRSNTSDSEATNSEGVLDFDDNGLLKIGTDAFLNESGTTMVIWNWKAGGTAVSNTDGTITSSVSANTDAGFSIVSYSGNGVSGATLGHGLSQAPNFAICKKRSATANWRVGTDGTGTLIDGYFNLTNSMAADSTTYQAFNSSTITLGDSQDVNGSGVTTYIMYVFHDVEGYSKFGSYTGNGSSDGTFVYTGFRPAWLMVKVTNISGENWHMFDSERAPFNVVVPRLIADDSTAENNNDNILDFTSNGFKWRDSNAGYNGSGNTYIFMCFAENPFKYANGR